MGTRHCYRGQSTARGGEAQIGRMLDEVPWANTAVYSRACSLRSPDHQVGTGQSRWADLQNLGRFVRLLLCATDENQVLAERFHAATVPEGRLRELAPGARPDA